MAIDNIQPLKTRGVHKNTQTVEMHDKDQQSAQICEPCTPIQLNTLFLKLANDACITTNPSNFASLALKAIMVLEEHGKSNLLYKFAYCLATNPPGISRPLFDPTRMPFGLVEYQIEFFSCTNITQIRIPDDYHMWHETMCAEFPNRFNRLFRGPMWSGTNQELSKNPLHAKVNVAGPSTRNIQKKAAVSDFVVEPKIQVEALKQLKASNPKGRFWIKADAFDVSAALQESVKGTWNGDVDLGDYRLQQLRKDYDKRRMSS
ncbi:uncharacterized protein LOC116306685 [Actinia tenebrosa]|uniref:Uncharacterized protein LOC116306685 n=1 Tax=Actinia tenebrosa TaxID=6105 RepID=A0A6P8IZN0_ACTTE|nr:uncharacterized protein LOC116306685 [Actinia tenebrosa]